MFPASLNKDIVVEFDIEGELSDEEIRQHIQNASRTIKDLLRCLGEMKREVKKCM
jgi:transcription initiation factor IIE alpha subunit